MNKVIIKNITIRNFKGIASFKTDFNEDITKFYGENGSGKTTIKNAWEWALCRNVSDYLPNLNNKEIPELITSVEVTLSVNDLEYILKRESKSKFNKDKVKTGNEATYTIDGIEVSQKQYQSQIASIIGDGIVENLPMLTDKEFFNTDTTAWKWQNRRKILLSMTGAEQEANEIVKQDKYACIRDSITKGYATSDIKSGLIKEGNALKKKQEGNLLLIEAKQKELDEYLGIDFEKVSQELSTAKTKYTKLINASKKENATDELKKLDDEILKYSQEISSLKTRDIIKRKDIEEFKLKIFEEAVQTKSEYDKQVAYIKQAEANIKEQENITIKDFCQVCGQPLPQHKIDEVKANIDANIKTFKSHIEEYKQKAKMYYEKYNNLQSQYEEQLEKLKNFAPNEKIAEFEAKLAELNSTVRSKRQTDLSNLSSQEQKDLETKISDLERELAKKEYLDKGYKQIKLWKEENMQVAEDIIAIEDKEYALQDFVREQTDIIVKTVNSFFGNGVSWSLYTTNYNGNLEECCECMYNNKLYSCLSTGEKNKTNIEVIKALQNFYDVNIPIFCDNAETVTIEYETDRQIIELYAKAGARLEGCTKITDLY